VAETGTVTIAYEAYGELNRERTNAILIVHALSGMQTRRVFTGRQEAGMVDGMIGPGKVSIPISIS